MTRRDALWRAAGGALMAGACAATQLGSRNSALSLLWFLVAIAGLVLLLNGKRVATVWRAERGRHRHTAERLHASRVRHRRQGPDGFEW